MSFTLTSAEHWLAAAATEMVHEGRAVAQIAAKIPAWLTAHQTQIASAETAVEGTTAVAAVVPGQVGAVAAGALEVERFAFYVAGLVIKGIIDLGGATSQQGLNVTLDKQVVQDGVAIAQAVQNRAVALGMPQAAQK